MQRNTYAFVAGSYDLWTFVVDPTSIQYDAWQRYGSTCYGRPVIPDAETGRLRLTREGEAPFGYLGNVMMDGHAECIARKPAEPRGD